MKHKHFNQVFPYTYYIKHVPSGKKYHGVRFANVAKGIAPVDDLAINYFSSGKFEKMFRESPSEFEYKIAWTFDTVDEALAYESKINTKLMALLDWEVWTNGKAIFMSEEIRNKIGNGNRGKPRTEETRKKLSESAKKLVNDGIHVWKTAEHSERNKKRMKENNPSFGGLSEEHKRKIGESSSAALKGKPKSESHRAAMSESRKGKSTWNKGMKGIIKMSEETKQKMRESRLGKKRGPYNWKKKNKE